MKVRISLSEKDFRELVAGKVVKPDLVLTDDGHTVPVEIALQDIGWSPMCNAILDAENDQRRKR